MFVEIAICTWNRATLLEKTLSSLCQLVIPNDIKWQILLVDNNSSDHTSDVIKKFGKQLPIVSLFEEKQGHTFARNCAVEAAKGELLIWTDDDCTFNTNWLANYVFASSDTRYDFWGAAIEPFFDGEEPKWIRENWEICKGCFAARDLGPRPVHFSQSVLPYGANFAVRTEIQKSYLFDEDLGRKGDEVFGEDELDFMRRILAKGIKGVWTPDNPVQHLIPRDRATTQYVFDYFVGQGKNLATSEEVSKSQFKLRTSAFWNWWMFKLKRNRVDSHVWISHLIQSALEFGQCRHRRS